MNISMLDRRFGRNHIEKAGRVVHRLMPTLTTTYPQIACGCFTGQRNSGSVNWFPRLNEAKDTGDRASSNRKAEKTLAGVGVSVRRRWLKGKTHVRQPLANVLRPGRRSELLTGGSPAGTMRAPSGRGHSGKQLPQGRGERTRERDDGQPGRFRLRGRPISQTRSDVARRRKTTALESKAAAGANRP